MNTLTAFESYRARTPRAELAETLGKWQLWAIREGGLFYFGEWFNTETGDREDPYRLAHRLGVRPLDLHPADLY